jgi:diphthamide biosynthesis methyltransferase
MAGLSLLRNLHIVVLFDMEEGEASSFSALQHLLKLSYSEDPGTYVFGQMRCHLVALFAGCRCEKFKWGKGVCVWMCRLIHGM